MPPEKRHKATDVFGLGRELPLNYQSRPTADDVLINSLTRDKHLVIYGSSKQGKTCLRKHCLKEDDYVVVHCSNKWSISDIHSSLLKQAGYEVTQSKTKATTGKQKISAKAKTSLFGSGLEAAAETGQDEQNQEIRAPLELDPDDVNDIISALDNIHFNRFIILEDFHYLPIETQQDFSVALKAFHENSSHCFIIIGVWLEENRLTVYNGDLTGRVLAINADKWTRAELDGVVRSGENLLNIQFNDAFRSELLDSSFESVFIVQEACYACCEADGIRETQGSLVEIGTPGAAAELVRKVVSQHTGRFNSFIAQFADGFQASELEMYRWLLFPILTSDVADLEKGLRQADIRKTLQEGHPKGKDLNAGNVTQALLSVGALQIKKDIKPTVLDYDQTNLRLNVVDRSFLIWLQQQERSQLLETAGLPIE